MSWLTLKIWVALELYWMPPIMEQEFDDVADPTCSLQTGSSGLEFSTYYPVMQAEVP
jgi:hypothetical protein